MNSCAVSITFCAVDGVENRGSVSTIVLADRKWMKGSWNKNAKKILWCTLEIMVIFTYIYLFHFPNCQVCFFCITNGNTVWICNGKRCSVPAVQCVHWDLRLKGIMCNMFCNYVLNDINKIFISVYRYLLLALFKIRPPLPASASTRDPGLRIA